MFNKRLLSFVGVCSLLLLLSLLSLVVNGCNFALSSLPIAEDECSYGTSGSQSTSIKLECSSSSDTTGTLYSFNNRDCSGTPINSSTINAQCGNSGDCNIVTLSGTYYFGTTQCTGNAQSGYSLEYKLAKLNGSCFSWNSASYKITTGNDGVFVKGWSGNGCSGTPAVDVNITDGCQVDGGNSTNLDFNNTNKNYNLNFIIIYLFSIFSFIFY